MRLFGRSQRDSHESPTTEPGIAGTCAICGRDLWSDGLAPAHDGDAWICGDCDQARNFEADAEAGAFDDFADD